MHIAGRTTCAPRSSSTRSASSTPGARSRPTSPMRWSTPGRIPAPSSCSACGRCSTPCTIGTARRHGARPLLPAGLVGGALTVRGGVREHVDAASRVHGFVALLLPFCEVTYVDLRPLRVDGPGLRQAGVAARATIRDCIGPSLSCLHVLEHLGLGRYGDPVDPRPSGRGASELCAGAGTGWTPAPGTPVGRERPCFDAHRVFDPRRSSAHSPTWRWQSSIASLIRVILFTRAHLRRRAHLHVRMWTFCIQRPVISECGRPSGTEQRMKKVLVTGSCGLIGCEVRRLFRRQG